MRQQPRPAEPIKNNGAKEKEKLRRGVEQAHVLTLNVEAEDDDSGETAADAEREQKFAVAGTIAAPLIMISLGVSLDFSAFRGASVSLATLTGVKLLVLPALAIGFGWLFGTGDAVRMLAIEAGMPTALLALIVSQRFGLDAEYVAAASLTTTVCCVVSIPLVQLLIR